MTTCLFLNNYRPLLANPLSSTGTVMSVSSTTGLPASLSSGQFIPMTLTPASNPGSVYEIVYVTGISGANLTVTRGQEGTSPLNWQTGDITYATNTAATTQSPDGNGNASVSGTFAVGGELSANGGISIPVGQPLTGIPNDIAGSASGLIGASQVVILFKAVRSVIVQANFSGSVAEVIVAFTNAATFSIITNGTTVGSLSFAAGSRSGVFSSSNAFTIPPAADLFIGAPSTADPTAADLAITIMASLA